jgi:hypothetical protein
LVPGFALAVQQDGRDAYSPRSYHIGLVFIANVDDLLWPQAKTLQG